MKTAPVTSSSISALAWDEGQLFVTFQNGRTYAYDDVPVAVFDTLVGADSVGREFNLTVKGKFNYRPMSKSDESEQSTSEFQPVKH